MAKILNSSSEFGDDLIRQLLVRKDLNHLLMSDITDLIHSIKRDFPSIADVETIGYTWEKRPMELLTIDAREYLLRNLPLSDKSKVLNKPAILITGAHHPRELTSIQMPLFSVLRLLHGLIHHK